MNSKFESRVTPQIMWSHTESRDEQKIDTFTPAFSFRPIIMSIRQSWNSAWTFEILRIVIFWKFWSRENRVQIISRVDDHILNQWTNRINNYYYWIKIILFNNMIFDD